VQLAARTVTARDWLMLRLDTDDGCTGYGFSFAGYEGGARCAQAVNTLFAPLILGADPDDAPRLWWQMFQWSGKRDRSDKVMRALSAIDIALWDRNSRAAGLPLYKYLGVARATPLRVYVGSGYYGTAVETAAAEIAELADRGYDAIKVKVGRLPVNDESRRVLAFRRAAGELSELMVDANGAWADVPTARRYIAALSEAAISMVEDPLPPDDLSGCRQLRHSVSLPISVGELFTTPDDFSRAIDGDAMDVAQVDATACGGVTAFRAIVALCKAAGVSVETHWFPELHVHLAMTSEVCRRIEVFPDAEIVNFGKLATSSAALAPKSASPGGEPGHGVQLACLDD
jgi:L-alanine-DL-glutamate epimerase-like enolase superfamily enzyme